MPHVDQQQSPRHPPSFQSQSPFSPSANINNSSHYLDWTLDERKMIHIPTEIADRVSLLHRVIYNIIDNIKYNVID
jgi:hypothetical protein